MLATTEAFANAVEHGRALRPARHLRCAWSPRTGASASRSCDCGGRFPGAHDRTKRPERHGEGGRGMPIIAAVMDQLEVKPDTGRTRVRFGSAWRAA